MKRTEVALPYTEDCCYKCLERKKGIQSFSVAGRGYGSHFDSSYSQLQICLDCTTIEELELLKLWFNERPSQKVEWCEDYQYEDEIQQYISHLPIQAQEWFENTTAKDSFCEPQDWIDMKLGIAPDEVYYRYQLYSPSEIRSYKERFPICQNVYLKTYGDESRHTKCDYGAFGDENGETGSNICSECYRCDSFKPRDCEEQLLKENKVLTVELKPIRMYELICPTCKRNHLLYSKEVEFEAQDFKFCPCGQELAFDPYPFIEEAGDNR